MKNFLFTAAFLIIIFSVNALTASEIAVLPYKINNPGMNFSVDAGIDYAKLIGIGAAVQKGVSLYPAFQLKKDLRSFGIDPSVAITEDNISLLSKSRMIDFVITGSILKTGEGYISKSILYSSSSGKIINNSTVKADTLENLAEKEISSLFLFLPDLNIKSESGQISETLIIADTSILTSFELNDIRKKIPEIYTSIKSISPDSRIYFTNYPSSNTGIKQIKSYSELESVSARLINSGKNTNLSYEDILSKGISGIQWEKNSNRNIIFITNSQIQKSSVIFQLSSKAQNKKIKISHILLSKTDKSSSIIYNDISVKTGGFIKDVTYHQRLVDGQGNDYHLFYERERLFISEINPSEWKNGIFKYSGSRDTHVKTASYLDEIDIAQRNKSLNAFSLDKFYRQYGERTVVSSDKAESNFETILNNFTVKFLKLESGSAPAKVLLSQFNTSVWVNIYDKNDIPFFQNALNSGSLVLTGLTIFPDSNSPYGIGFGNRILTQFSYDDIPLSLKSEFKKIISDKNRYINEGFLTPAIWFFDVKVEKVILLESENDIRN
ncbi:MAG: hypothetical protein JW982_15310 [Spirochaetes bacterium]|nr:hypothetical protein [Spirochaetota bacterium]